MNRRRFLLTILSFLGLGAFGLSFYSALRYLLPPVEVSQDVIKRIKKEEIPTGRSKDIVVNNIPVIVINIPQKGYVAYSRVCTHLGCLVQFEPEKRVFICPCHGGTFDINGNVVSGPPPRPLTRIPLRIEGDEIIIG
ncbi:MAG: ubiquinol-cytochrome c reductase iron-sulfur subunit [Thermodesulfovibrionales bacterium]